MVVNDAHQVGVPPDAVFLDVREIAGVRHPYFPKGGGFKSLTVFDYGSSFKAQAVIIDFHLIEKGSAVRTAVIFFYLSNEGLSIMENAARVGLPIPEILKTVFTELKREGGKNG